MELSLLTGPPRNPHRDQAWVNEFLSRPGKKVVCGGTTIGIVARHLQGEPEVVLESAAPGVPPWGVLTGMDLITEGVITIEHMVNDWEKEERGQSRETLFPTAPEKLKTYLKEADRVNLMVGRGAARARITRELYRLLKDEQKKVIINLY